MSAGQIAAPSAWLRAPIVSALIVGAFVLGMLMGFGPLRGLGNGIPATAAGGSSIHATLPATRHDAVKDDVYTPAARRDVLKDDIYTQAARRDVLKDDVYASAARGDLLKDDVYTPSR